MLTYHCGLGKYPFPVSYRVCGADGEWSVMRLANGRPTSHATCKGNVMDDDAFSVSCTQKESAVHHLELSLCQMCCVRLSSSWITATSGPGVSGSTSGRLRASPAWKGSPCTGQPRGTAPPLGSGQEPPLSVTTTVRMEKVTEM